MHEQEIYHRVRDHIFSDNALGLTNPESLHVRLLDAQYAADGSVAVLASYTQQSANQQQTPAMRAFCVAVFHTQDELEGEELFLADRIELTYTAVRRRERDR